MVIPHAQMNWKVILVIITSTLVLSVDRYRNLFNNFGLDQLFWYLALPLIIIVLVLRESPVAYGLSLGDWKAGLVMTLLAGLGISLFVPFVSQIPAFQEYYAASSMTLPQIIANEAIETIGWEFFFRGFLLFALFRVAGMNAIWLQAVPFTLAHFGKPELEVLSCIFGGTIFGYIAWRSKSFIYPFIIHTYLAVLIVYMCSG
jgi:membrane protease YdiL (CAAX protease family)